MEFFHVCIERGNEYNNIVTQNDISEIDLIERIVSHIISREVNTFTVADFQ